MQVTNHVLPLPDQIEAMKQDGPGGPIFMVNLLKFRDRAEYDDGRETELTGRDAYNLYGAGVAGIISDYGGKVVFVGDVTGLMIGEADVLWDEVVIAMYPNRAALLAMSTSAAWRQLSVHRSAGLEGQLNIETVMPLGFSPPT